MSRARKSALPKNLQWAKPEDKSAVHKTLFPLVQAISSDQSYRRNLYERHYRLYAGRNARGLTADTYSVDDNPEYGTAYNPGISINIVRNYVDTAVSKIGKNKPAAEFLTTDGEWEVEQQAKELKKFTDACMHHGRAYQESITTLQNACTFGTGLTKVIQDGTNIRYETVLPTEILVDDTESIYGKPRNMYQIKLYDRGVLKARFPKFAKEIEQAGGQTEQLRPWRRDPLGDQVAVLEAWHLPTSKGAKDGAHAIVTDNATLLFEEYKRDRFPFAVMHWSKEPLGFWGTGIAQQLTGLQYEINQIFKTLSTNIRLAGTLKILVEQGSRIQDQHLSNLPGAIIPFLQTPPQYLLPPSIDPALLGHLQFLLGQAPQLIGISQMSSQGQVPASLSSGRAQIVYQNIESERFATQHKSWNQFFVDLAELTIEAARDIYEREGEFAVQYVGKSALERVSFQDAMLERDKYEIQSFDISSLPQNPAARLAHVEQMVATGIISRELAPKLLQYPDIDREMEIINAPVNLIEKRLSDMARKRIYMPPHTRMNLPLAKERAQLAYQRAELNNAPPEILDLYDTFISDVDDLIMQAQPPQVPAEQAAAVPNGQPAAA